MSKTDFLAFDLGAESGRTILGTLNKGQLDIKELHRFSNRPVSMLGHLHWNIASMFEELKTGLRICAAEPGAEPVSYAIDTWGVDYGLLGSDGSFLGLPYAYRDPRTEGAIEGFFERMPAARVYELTGIQFMPFNTLFQLFAMVRDRSPLKDAAADLLFMPDIFNYLLCGARRTEFSYATTSQLYNPVRKDWEDELFAALGISKSIMQQIVPSGTVIGELNADIAGETGLGRLKAIATASHDTASAVAAVPAEGEDWAYISSGTWSLMGIEIPEPVISEQARRCQFTNEGGAEGTIRFLKNIMGLWLLQQCRRAWASEREYSYEELAEMAGSGPAFKAVVDPDCLEFYNPPDMPEAIVNFCRRRNLPYPETHSEFVRCILESLALKYRLVLDMLREVQSQPINRIHIIGGGTRNKVLCQFAADATGVPVIAGPVEATAMGNIMVQAMALGHVDSLSGIRSVIRGSCKPEVYEPRDSDDWNEAYGKFKTIVENPYI